MAKEYGSAEKNFANKIATSILGVIFLGAIGSGVWELIAKPGLGGTGRFFLSLLTLGSTRLRDAAYTSAALDPTSLPSLLVLMIFTSLPLGFVISVLLYQAGRRRRYREVEDFYETVNDLEMAPHVRGSAHTHRREQRKSPAARNGVSSEREGSVEIEERAPKRMSWSLYIINLVLVVVLSLSFLLVTLTVGQAIFIYRVFNASIVACSPFLTDSEEDDFRARFALMRSKAEYETIDRDLNMIAIRNGLHLEDFDLW